MLQSLATNHALMDGNKRTALGAAFGMLALNGYRLDMPVATAVELTVAVATRHIVDVSEIAELLKQASRPCS